MKVDKFPVAFTDDAVRLYPSEIVGKMPEQTALRSSTWLLLKQWNKTDTVYLAADLFVLFDASHLQERRKDVFTYELIVTDRSRPGHTGPFDDHRDPDTSFIGGPFDGASDKCILNELCQGRPDSTGLATAKGLLTAAAA